MLSKSYPQSKNNKQGRELEEEIRENLKNLNL
jgi:hypothetical protein